jgi:hypothetical protein
MHVTAHLGEQVDASCEALAPEALLARLLSKLGQLCRIMVLRAKALSPAPTTAADMCSMNQAESC